MTKVANLHYKRDRQWKRH